MKKKMIMNLQLFAEKLTLEQIQEQMLTMQEQITTLTNENSTLKTTVSDKEKREKELEEHNQKLFLRVTSKVEPQVQEESEDEKIIKEHIGEKTYNSLSKRDIENFKIIMNGEDE